MTKELAQLLKRLLKDEIYRCPKNALLREARDLSVFIQSEQPRGDARRWWIDGADSEKRARELIAIHEGGGKG